MISSGINLVMTVIGFAVSTMFVVFVCTRLICARIQLNASRRSFHLSSRSDLSILERGLHGLEPLVVANFPTKKYNDPFFSFSEDTQCSVCLSEYHPEDTLRILPFCGHSFHSTCIDIWLQKHSTCPVCRISLRDVPEKRRFMQPMYSSAIRSQYGMGSHMVNSYHCHNHRDSTRAHESRRMNPIQEDEFRLRGDGAVVGENNSVMIDSNSMTKDMTNKRLESPSNP